MGQRVGAQTLMPRRVEASQGGGPNLEKVGPRRVPLGGPKFRAFFLPATIWNFGGVWSAGALKCVRYEFSGCEAPAAPKVPAFKNTTKIPQKDQQEMEKRKKIVVGEGKKSEILGRGRGSRLRGVRPILDAPTKILNHQHTPTPSHNTLHTAQDNTAQDKTTHMTTQHIETRLVSINVCLQTNLKNNLA